MVIPFLVAIAIVLIAFTANLINISIALTALVIIAAAMMIDAIMQHRQRRRLRRNGQSRDLHRHTEEQMAHRHDKRGGE